MGFIRLVSTSPYTQAISVPNIIPHWIWCNLEYFLFLLLFCVALFFFQHQVLSKGIWIACFNHVLSAFIFSITGYALRKQVNDTVCDDAGQKHSQPAAISILNGPFEDCRHIAYFQSDAFPFPQLKLTSTNQQVVNHQTGWGNVTWFHVVCPSAFVCIHVSTHLSRPYMTLPIKSRDFSPLTLGYLAFWNAASITFVVFSFTAKNTQKHTCWQRDLNTGTYMTGRWGNPKQSRKNYVGDTALTNSAQIVVVQKGLKRYTLRQMKNTCSQGLP